MSISKPNMPRKPFQTQKAMLRVCYALLPLVMASVYFFGWRSLALLAVILLFGLATEAAFCFGQNKPVTSAVLVTCLIFHLSLPPTLPLWMAALGIVVGVGFGKMVFGGFGRNLFNPAMVGRCFLYINFPYALTGRWVEPWWGGAGGFSSWQAPVDAVTRATPLWQLKSGVDIPWLDLLAGNVSGSLGETSALLALGGGAYLFLTRTASWRLALSCILGGWVMNSLLHATSHPGMPAPWTALLAGSFIFGSIFVVTEPISGAKLPLAQWFYGFLAGGLTVVLRQYSNFAEGIMFAVLIVNAFAPLLDESARRIKVLGHREAAT